MPLDNYSEHTFDDSPAGKLWNNIQSTRKDIYLNEEKAGHTDTCKVMRDIQPVFDALETVLQALSKGGSPSPKSVAAFVSSLGFGISVSLNEGVSLTSAFDNLDVSRLKITPESEQLIHQLRDHFFQVLYKYRDIKSIAPFLHPEAVAAIGNNLSKFLGIKRADSDEEKTENWRYQGSVGALGVTKQFSFDLKLKYQSAVENIFRDVIWSLRQKYEPLCVEDNSANSLCDRLLLQAHQLASLQNISDEYQKILGPDEEYIFNQIELYKKKSSEYIKNMLDPCLQDLGNTNAAEKIQLLISVLKDIKHCEVKLKLTEEQMKFVFGDYPQQIQAKIIVIQGEMAAGCRPDAYDGLIKEVKTKITENERKIEIISKYFPVDAEEKSAEPIVTVQSVAEKINTLNDKLSQLNAHQDILKKILACIQEQAQDQYFPFHEIEAIIVSHTLKPTNKIGTVLVDNEFFKKDFCWLVEDLELISGSDTSVNFLKTPIVLYSLALCRHKQSNKLLEDKPSAEYYKKMRDDFQNRIAMRLSDLVRQAQQCSQDVSELEVIQCGLAPETDVRVPIVAEIEKLKQQETRFDSIQKMLKRFVDISTTIDGIESDKLHDEKALENNAAEVVIDIDDFLTLHNSNELASMNTALNQLREQANSYMDSNKKSLLPMDSAALKALIATIDMNNPVKKLQDQIIRQCSERWNEMQKIFYDKRQEELNKILIVTFSKRDVNLVLFSDEATDGWAAGHRAFPESDVSPANNAIYNEKVKNSSRQTYTKDLKEQERRLGQVKALRVSFIDMYHKGTVLIDAGRKEEGENFRILAVKLANMSCEYVKTLDMTQDDFCGKLSYTLANDDTVKSIKNNRFWPIVVGNILVACLSVGLSIPIQIGLYACYRYILFAQTDRESKIDTLKDRVEEKFGPLPPPPQVRC